MILVPRSGRILITGATGFLGHYVAASLLRRGKRCAAMVRPGKEGHLRSLFGEIDALVDEDRLTIVEGVLPDALPTCIAEDIGAILHVAGVTRFAPDRTGEPMRTNVEGTRALLEWAAARGIGDFHYVSTAYVCGKGSETVRERVGSHRPAFHNVYEESKWDAERLCADWAAHAGRRLTIYRPSIVVGESATGRATQFRGFYLLVRAMELLAGAVAEKSPQKRHEINLRIPGRPEGRIDLVPVDYVAEVIAHVVASPRYHGGVYHLTHPNPATNGQIKRWLEAHFDIGGGRFVGPAAPDDDVDGCERIFYDVVGSVVPYWANSPLFERDRTERVLHGSGIECPDVDEAYVSRLAAFAQQARWGRSKSRKKSVESGEDCARYFERFLPEHVRQSRVATRTAVSTIIRFVIRDVPDGQWSCRFDRGELVDVRRRSNGLVEAFGYRAPKRVFWDAISGRVLPELLLYEDGVEIFGDVEQALKMAAILHEFTKEFPCDPQRLATY